MTESDLITEKRLDTVELALRRAFAFRVAASVVGGAIFCALFLLVAYLLPVNYDQDVIVPLIILASATLAAWWALADWRAHRQERRRIAALRERLRAGEILSMLDVKAPNSAA